MKTRTLTLFLALCALAAPLRAGTLNAASYNIRQLNSGDDAAGDGWAKRCPRIASLVRFHDFDIFGTQEGKITQLQNLIAALPGYARTGVGRDNGVEAGEFSAIFYKTAKFTLLDHGDFWLSETPGVPSNGFGASRRICSWGKFSETQTGKVFYFFNLHMDASSGQTGIDVREKAARVVVAKIPEIANGADFVLTGDFNMVPTQSAYSVLTAGGQIKDSRHLARLRYENSGTLTGYEFRNIGWSGFQGENQERRRIDYVFISAGFSVARYGVLADIYHDKTADETLTARYPSDHHPVIATLEY